MRPGPPFGVQSGCAGVCEATSAGPVQCAGGVGNDAGLAAPGVQSSCLVGGVWGQPTDDTEMEERPVDSLDPGAGFSARMARERAKGRTRFS